MAARRYTETQFRAAVDDPEVRTMADLCRALGLVPRGGNYESLRAYASTLDIDLRHLLVPPGLSRATPRRRRSYTDEDLLEALEHCRNPPARRRREHEEAALRDAVARARTRREALRLLGDTPGSLAYRRLERGIQRHGIDASHLTPRTAGGRERRPLAQLLVEDSRANTTRLRQRLIEEGYKDPACEDCGTRRWLGKPVPLELDHINGDRSDNRLTNLRLLCPNCHALTPTYRGRNIGRAI